MNAYVINILLIMFWAMALLLFNPNKLKKKAFIAIASIQWIFVSGLRNITSGADPDTIEYLRHFNIVKNMPWSKIPTLFYNTYIKGVGKDPGYTVLVKLVQVFTKNYQCYLVIVAIILFSSLAVWVYKNSKMPCFSYILFSTLFYSFFAVTGIRQTIATALVVFIGTELIKKRKFFPFLLICLIAFTIHKSSICLLPFYFISQKKITRKYILFVLALLPIVAVFRNQFLDLLNFISGYEYEELSTSGAKGFTFFYFVIVIVSLILLRYVRENSKNYKMYYNALFLGMLFIPLVFVNPSLMRVVQYFSVYLMLLVPELIMCIQKKYRNLVYIAIVIVLMIITNIYTANYSFFWQ